MKYITGASFFEDRSPDDVRQFVAKNFDISEQVTHLLDRKGWSQKDLALAVGKSESEISRWLCGTHNITLRSIARMEAALGEDIIITPMKMEESGDKIHTVYMTAIVYTSQPELDEDIDYDCQNFGAPSVRQEDMQVA